MELRDRPESLIVWKDLCEIVDMVRLAVNRDLQRQAGVTLSENLVLCYVAMAPEQRLRMVDIAELLAIGKSAVTKTVDRLEKRGLLERRRETTDRRTVYATLTRAGEEVFSRAQPAFADAVDHYFSTMFGDADLRQIKEAAARIRRLVTEQGLVSGLS